MSQKRDKKSGRFTGTPVAQNSYRTVDISGKSLKAALIGESKRASRALPKAAIAAARKFVRHLVERTDEMGITDRGILKNSWRAERRGNGATVFSDAPHAGIVELGARPHKVSKEGRENIAAWAMRKLGLSAEEAQAASWAFVKKLNVKGQEPTYLVQDAIPAARRFFAEEFARVMRTEPRPVVRK